MWNYDDTTAGTDHYRAAIEKPMSNLTNPRYHNINWGEPTMDGIADSTEGAMYLVNRLPVPEAIKWIDREVKDLTSGETFTIKGTELHAGLPVVLAAGI